MFRTMLVAFSMLLCAHVGLPAQAGEVPIGAKVRVVANGAGGWYVGVLKKGGPCTMVFLEQPTPEGYSAFSLNALRAIQVAEGRSWTATHIAPLLAKETKECREAANG